MPWFVLGFIAVMLLNSVITMAPPEKAQIVTLTNFLLSMALAAMGLETDFAKLKREGLRPLLLAACAWIFIAGFSLALVKLVRLTFPAMTLEQLRIFVAVAEREHVTRAAEAIHRTQSAVSAAIAGLEHQSGVTLFHRVGRRIALTEEGRQFLVEARAVIAQADAAERALADLAGMKRGTLTLMASQTIASYWLPPKLVQYRARHPNVTVKAMIGNTAEVADAVEQGRVEIGLVEGAVKIRRWS